MATVMRRAPTPAESNAAKDAACRAALHSKMFKSQDAYVAKFTIKQPAQQNLIDMAFDPTTVQHMRSVECCDCKTVHHCSKLQCLLKFMMCKEGMLARLGPVPSSAGTLQWQFPQTC